jgi:predicted anti-sigma-YlaC factor YlaD
MTDRFTTYDAAYLLGALSPGDRREYEAHLRECDECSHAVARLAGLPGLLAKATRPEPVEPVPETLLPKLIAEVTRRRTRSRRLIVAALAAAAVLAALLGTVAGLDEPPRPPDEAQAGVSMTPVLAGTPIRAAGTYGLVVTDDAGTPQRLATWSAVPGQVSTVAGSTSLRPDQIASVEVRDAQDRPVLTLAPDSDPLEE